MITLCMSYRPIHHHVTAHWTCICHIFTQISSLTKCTWNFPFHWWTICSFSYHTAYQTKTCIKYHWKKKKMYKIAVCYLFKMENKVEDSYFDLNHDTERAPHEKMNCTCTRLNYGCNYFPVNIFMVLWFPARLTLLEWRGSTTICSWRRRCGQAGSLWSRNTGRSRLSGLAVPGLKRSAPNCLQSMRPSWQR